MKDRHIISRQLHTLRSWGYILLGLGLGWSLVDGRAAGPSLSDHRCDLLSARQVGGRDVRAASVRRCRRTLRPDRVRLDLSAAGARPGGRPPANVRGERS